MVRSSIEGFSACLLEVLPFGFEFCPCSWFVSRLGSRSSDLPGHICNSANHPLAVVLLLQECEDVCPRVLFEALAVSRYMHGVPTLSLSSS